MKLKDNPTFLQDAKEILAEILAKRDASPRTWPPAAVAYMLFTELEKKWPTLNQEKQ